MNEPCEKMCSSGQLGGQSMGYEEKFELFEKKSSNNHLVAREDQATCQLRENEVSAPTLCSSAQQYINFLIEV